MYDRHLQFRVTGDLLQTELQRAGWKTEAIERAKWRQVIAATNGKTSIILVGKVRATSAEQDTWAVFTIGLQGVIFDELVAAILRE